MTKRELIADLISKRAAMRSAIDEVLKVAQSESRGLTDDESSRFDTDESEIRALDDRISELDAQLRMDEASEEMRKRYAPSVQVTSEPEVYRKANDGRSYFRDLHLARNKGDRDALDRLIRNDRIRAAQDEKRAALSTANGGGGEFVPPLWLEQDFIAFARPGRVVANLCPTMELPAGTDSINIPKINTGTQVAPQTAQNGGVLEQDLTTTSVSSPVVTIAGGQTVSLQLLEQSPLNIDSVVLADLAAAYAVQLDTQVIQGAGTGGTLTGITTLAGTNALAFTSASPTLAALYSKLAGAIQAIHTSRFLPPDAIIMHPRRWAWAIAQQDTQGRPLVVPAAGGPMNAVGNLSANASQGFVGSMLGLPVYVDASLPTNLGTGTNQDVVLVARMADLMLWESDIRAEAFQQTYAQNMSVYVRLYNYASFQPGRYPQSISVVSGTGLVAPTF